MSTDLDSSIEFDPGFTAAAILHPATYVNKVLISSSQGNLQLWNIRSEWVHAKIVERLFWFSRRTCIYKFEASKLLSLPSAHDPGSAVTALNQSPAIDVVGIGFASGNIVIYDVRADEKLIRMFMEGGSVRALGFRSGMWSNLRFKSLKLHCYRWTTHISIRFFRWAHCDMGFKRGWPPPSHDSWSSRWGHKLYWVDSRATCHH